MSTNTILASAPLTSTGYHLKANGTTLGNSLIWDNGTNVGIGNTNTSYTLDVSGTGRFTSTLLVSGALTGTSATFSSDLSVINTSNALLKVYSNTTSSPIADIELMRGTNTTWGADAYTDYRIRSSGGDLLIQSGESTVTSTRLTIASTGAATFTNNVTVSSASTSGFIVNSTNNASFRGFTIQANGTTQGGIEALPNTGEIRIGGYSTGNDYFPVFYSDGVERMRITSGGLFLVNVTSSLGYGSAHRIYRNVSEGDYVIDIDGGVEYSSIFMACTGGGYNINKAGQWLGKNSSNNRSINAGGTINASGADYAEYMTKAIDEIILKGDIVGVNENGKLTNIFTDAKSFVVKSTDPSYVGGDSWGSIDIIGKLSEDATEEEKAEYEIKLEEARAKVDRIAFSGQIPCNVLNAKVGDYIIPINNNGKISGQAVTKPTFEQYQLSVGKVWKIMEDGRAWIAVKIG